MTLKVVIDAGHGYSTPGKRSPSPGVMKEYEFNRAVSLAMRDELKNYEGVEVKFTHSDSRDVPLSERTNSANAWKADVFVSIHANAFNGKMGDHGGIDTFVFESKPAEAVKLANVVQKNLIKATGLRDRGVKSIDFHVLRETHMTAILIEHGFMDSKTDLPKLKSDAYRKLCGETNAKSLAEFYGLKRKSAPKPAAKKEKKPSAAENKKATGFTDIPADFSYVDSIKFVQDKGLIKGYSDGSFRPNEPTTRGQLARILHRLLDEKK
ncbi:N-acetylmuramoyl-L-alanine amidase [Bacillus sp. 7894-2]|uniref:N-acetylmuramoyl-L-alanine amidase n=1 Tax=Bacillus sp. 7894-2 TaxID=2021695 RepID=UPI0015C6E52E|nr:N-acetylmuramoyl-L-alanine amidase [Bacillus sp. 7894-2]